jgi:type IV secretion system protein VirB9
MNRTLLTCAVVASLIGGPVRAEITPSPGGFDDRVHVVDYNPLNVVRVVGSPTNSTQILFAPREEISQVAIGDAEAWLAQPAGNLLFIKPIEVRPSTNMQVVTRRPDGSNRSYQFRLVAARRGASGESAAFFAVNFAYPDDERAARVAQETQQAAMTVEKSAVAQLADAWAAGPRNWRYLAQGSTLIEPTEVSDNGRQTAFRFPGNMRMPTIYAVAPDGAETLVAYTTVGDTTVAQTTARAFVLRDGQEVLRIVNQGFEPVGRNPGTGTGSPELTRSIRSSGL